MGGAVFTVIFFATATVLGLDVIIHNWTEFLGLIFLLVVALLVGRETVNKSHFENFDADFMIAGAVLVELALFGLGIIYVSEKFWNIDLLLLTQGYEASIRILAIILTLLFGYKIGQLKDDEPAEF